MTHARDDRDLARQHARDPFEAHDAPFAQHIETNMQSMLKLTRMTNASIVLGAPLPKKRDVLFVRRISEQKDFRKEADNAVAPAIAEPDIGG